MFSRVARVWPLLLFGLLLFSACSGGGSSTTGGGQQGGLNLQLITDKTSGPAPLTVSFFVTPSGGTKPYTTEWDFDNDGVVDSNAPSGQHVYLTSSIAHVKVTDKNGRVMTASQSITITLAPPVQDGTAPLNVAFNASPQVGQVPFPVQFTAQVTGGRAPLQYAWDFDGDGVFDSFVKDPLYTYTKVGQNLGNGLYQFTPVLQVTDARGVKATNLDDKDGVGGPDFPLKINALPPNQDLFVAATANPQAGQAPLSVEFTAAVSGATGPVEYRWNFGDNQQSAPSETSLITHTYDNAGTFLATVVAHDLETGLVSTSQPITINATQNQPFDLTIHADVTSGQVPFIVNFEALPVNGQEPIQYEWAVFDNDPANPNPDAQHPPTLNTRAVVTPDVSLRKNPSIHFGNTASAGNNPFEYRVRCSATDARGNQKVSTFVIVTALPHVQPPLDPTHQADSGFYSAERPQVVDQTFFPVNGFFGFGKNIGGSPTATSNAAFVSNSSAIAPARFQEWQPRANAAICSHPSGVTFIIGGERLGANGTFQGIVGHGDAMYAYVPTGGQSADGRGSPYGKYNQFGGLVRLNDGLSPPFPNSEDFAWQEHSADPLNRLDTVVPPCLDPTQPCAMLSDMRSTQRSTGFTVVGSAAAVFMHQSPETNRSDSYPGNATPFPQTGTDQIYLGSYGYYPWPDAAATNWNVDAPNAFGGLGEPVIFVIGGRTGAQSPVDTVQRYIVYGFGTEDIVPYSQDFRFQSSGNQADTWSNFFQTPDTDQYPGAGTNFDPQIEARNSGGQTPSMPKLPRPLYGHMAVRVESGVDAASPSFPNSPFDYVFVMGGIDAGGAVRNEMYWWDTAKGVQAGGNQDEDGQFSALPDMPTARAYGKAVLIPGSPMRIAVVGGFDALNRPLNTVDIYTFASVYLPTQGTWSTFGGTLEEALRTTAAGFHPGVAGDPFLLTFGGFEESDFTSKLRSIRLGSGLVVTEPLVVVPRGNTSSSQGGGGGIPNASLTFNRYTIVGGVTEQGTQNIVEVASLQ